ncbi:MAG: hypothetical protein KIS76_13700 [Pyrinomonadaceae bacterium]|nr:hypothetical protein [Pyrinomonadaceae bacterium]
MSETKVGEPQSDGGNKTVKYLILAGVILAAFLVGLIPATMSKWSAQQDLSAAQTKLRNSEVKVLLLSAIVESKRGEYENARQAASSFYTRLSEEQKSERERSFLSEQEIARLEPVFAERDAIITMLAQRDPASVERLTDIYLKFEEAVRKTAAENAPAR